MNGASPAPSPKQIPRVSYAQNMEDILLDRVFGDRTGTFMDVGASHPVVDSNTLFFSERGWRGVNLEPTPRLHALFREQRPGDLNLGVAASDVAGELPFYEISDSGGLSTLSTDLADEHRARGHEVVEHRVPVRTIACLIEEHGIAPPDFVSIDVEGHEAAVIRGIPLAIWRPGIFVVESTLPNTNIPCHQAWEPLLLENGYLFATFNGINRFYVREDLSEKLDRLRLPVNAVDDFVRPEAVHLRTLQEHFDRLRGIVEGERSRFEAERIRFEGERARFEAEYARFEAERIQFVEGHAQFEQMRAGWEWGRTQAEQVRAAWERDRAAMESERAAWRQTQEAFEQVRAAWDQERAGLELAQADSQWRQKEMEHLRVVWDRERARFEEDRAAWQQDRDRAFQELVATQRQLRPYRLLDRLGVVGSGYGLARRVKRRLVS